MPHAATGAHPFNAACCENSVGAGGFLIFQRAFMKNGERGNSRMRMPAEPWRARGRDVKEIQEHERLDELAEIRRADQSRDGSVPSAAGPKHNIAPGRGRFQQRAHAMASMVARAFT